MAEPTISVVKRGPTAYIFRKSGGETDFSEEAIKIQQFSHPYIAEFSKLENNNLETLAAAGCKSIQESLPALHGLLVEQRDNLIIQVMQALDYLHTRFTVHGFVNPSTIYIYEQRTKILLVDFRAASYFDLPKEQFNNGHFSPPEWHRMGIVSAKTDVFSVGIVYMCMAIGTLPCTWAADSDGIHMHARSIAPVWVKTMLSCDWRKRPMFFALLQQLHTYVQHMCAAAVVSTNPLFAAVEDALRFNNESAKLLEAWNSLSAVDISCPWKLVMPEMLMFAAMFLCSPMESDMPLLTAVITTLERTCEIPEVFSLMPAKFAVEQFSSFLVACFFSNETAVLKIMRACRNANISVAVNDSFAHGILKDDITENARALLRFTNWTPSMLQALDEMHAGMQLRKRQLEEQCEEIRSTRSTLQLIQRALESSKRVPDA